RWRKELRPIEGWDLLIIDECHFLKRFRVNRTHEIFGREKCFDKRIGKTRNVVPKESPDGSCIQEDGSVITPDGSIIPPSAATIKKAEVKKALNPIPAERILFLTGTPIVNRPFELWPILKTLRSQFDCSES